MKPCPKCQASTKQHKSGKTESGSQWYKCQPCGHRYTPEPKAHGYEDSVREEAVKMYVDGMNFRCIARQLKVNHQSVINRVNVHVTSLPKHSPQADKVTTVKMDELFTYVGKKKTKSM